MRTVPTINTSRLTLRAYLPQDFDDYAAMWAVPEVVAFVGGQPWSRTAAWTAFLRNAGHWQMTGFGLWAVEPHGTGHSVGQVGFFYGGRDLGEDFDSAPEASWIFHPSAQGRGFAREAVLAAHDWFDRVITGPLVCKLQPENTRSRAVADAMGYDPLRLATWDGTPSQLMLRKSPPGSPRNLMAGPEATQPHGNLH